MTVKSAAKKALGWFRKNAKTYREKIGEDAAHGQKLWALRTDHKLNQIDEYIDFLEKENQLLKGDLPETQNRYTQTHQFILFATSQMFELKKNELEKLLRAKAFHIQKIREETTTHFAADKENEKAKANWLRAEKLEAELNILTDLLEFNDVLYRSYQSEYAATVSKLQEKIAEKTEFNTALKNALIDFANNQQDINRRVDECL